MDRVSVKPKHQDRVSVLQLTDMHLFGNDDERLLGVDTAASFQAVLDAIMQEGRDIDIVLATGDLSQDYSYDSYNNSIHHRSSY